MQFFEYGGIAYELGKNAVAYANDHGGISYELGRNAVAHTTYLPLWEFFWQRRYIGYIRVGESMEKLRLCVLG